MSRKRNGTERLTKAIVSGDPKLLDDAEYRRGLEEYVLEMASRCPFCPNCTRVADEMRKRLQKAEGRS